LGDPWWWLLCHRRQPGAAAAGELAETAAETVAAARQCVVRRVVTGWVKWVAATFGAERVAVARAPWPDAWRSATGAAVVPV